MGFGHKTLILALIFGSGMALAGHIPPANAPRGFEIPKSTIIEVQNSHADEQDVWLRGRLTNYYGKDRYEFTDENGSSIEVELDDDRSWSHISKDQLIDIYGTVDRDMFSIKVEVYEALPVAVDETAK